jgi:proteic killer suppression protein
MIRSFRSKGLGELWSTGHTARIDARLHRRILKRLFELDAAKDVSVLNAPGFDFHALRGFSPTRYTIHINGPWCLTFEFENGEARQVDIEQYH